MTRCHRISPSPYSQSGKLVIMATTHATWPMRAMAAWSGTELARDPCTLTILRWSGRCGQGCTMAELAHTWHVLGMCHNVGARIHIHAGGQAHRFGIGSRMSIACCCPATLGVQCTAKQVSRTTYPRAQRAWGPAELSADIAAAASVPAGCSQCRADRPRHELRQLLRMLQQI